MKDKIKTDKISTGRQDFQKRDVFNGDVYEMPSLKSIAEDPCGVKNCHLFRVIFIRAGFELCHCGSDDCYAINWRNTQGLVYVGNIFDTPEKFKSIAPQEATK
jgi:hypothetical protein